MMQLRLLEQQKARTRSRKRINSGGPLEVAKAREKKEAKAKKERDDAIRRAERAIKEAVNKAKKALNRRGIDARKAERERKKAIIELQAKNKVILLDLLFPIRDPEKEPTLDELELLKPHPSLVQALEAIQPSIPIDPQLIEGGSNSDSDVDIRLEPEVEMVDIIHDYSDENEMDSPYSSESESIRSLDSIARNADFISLE
jgi:hypothetical protein